MTLQMPTWFFRYVPHGMFLTALAFGSGGMFVFAETPQATDLPHNGNVFELANTIWTTYRISVVPTATVFAYFVVIVFYDQCQRRRAAWTPISRSKLADSIYFLGFLFTLASICLTFITVGGFLRHLKTNEFEKFQGQIGLMVGFSGAALGTTLIGMLCRILFVQFEQEAETSPAILETDTGISPQLSDNAVLMADIDAMEDSSIPKITRIVTKALYDIVIVVTREKRPPKPVPVERPLPGSGILAKRPRKKGNGKHPPPGNDGATS